MDNPEEHAFLYELYTMTRGDTSTQVSMYDIGKTLGLEKTAAGSMAESLFIQGFAELKTLSGGISITVEGLGALDIDLPGSPDSPGLDLGKGPVIAASGHEIVNTLLADVKKEMAQGKKAYPQIEEMVMDIKTMEVQMLSPKPKTGIIKKIFESLHDNLKHGGSPALTEKLHTIISA